MSQANGIPAAALTGEPRNEAQPTSNSSDATPRSDASSMTSAPAQPIILSEAADGTDVLEADRIVQPLAQLCVASHVQTPFLAGVIGASGAGKSFALNRFANMAERGASAVGQTSRVVVVRVDAGEGAEAPLALASASYLALDRNPGGVDYSALLDDSAHAGSDPLRAAKAASDRHDEIVRRLEVERSQRDDTEARSARLPDALLFETPGSRVDVFARARRATIDARLRRFELAGSDSGTSYRELVRDMASLSAGGRFGVALRAIWAYPVQRSLIGWAIVAFIVGVVLHFLHGPEAINAIQQVPDAAGAAVADSAKKMTGWVASNGAWFETASKILYAIGALLLVLNLWRAASFSSLVMRGAQLLNQDVRDRRRDLDTRLARLNQRVATLSTEADAAARHAEAAARRAGGKTQARAPGPDFLDAHHNDVAAARGFLAALGKRMGASPSEGTPIRLIFVIDNLDALPPQAAIAWIDAATGALTTGAVGVLAFDPSRLVDALGGSAEARRRFDKWLQVVVNLPGVAGIDRERLVARLLASDGEPTLPVPDPTIGSKLAEPLSNSEAALLTALAPLAAGSPRAAKRFLNAYRLARSAKIARPAAALMLAVASADRETQDAMRQKLGNGGGELEAFDGPDVLARAVKSARAANGGVLTIADLRVADEIARRYVLSV